jgi:hypothetical protein
MPPMPTSSAPPPPSSTAPPSPGFTIDPSTAVPPENGVPVCRPSRCHRPTPLPWMPPPWGPAWPRDSMTVVGTRLHSRSFHACPSGEWRISEPSQSPPVASTVAADASSSGTSLAPQLDDNGRGTPKAAIVVVSSVAVTVLALLAFADERAPPPIPPSVARVLSPSRPPAW